MLPLQRVWACCKTLQQEIFNYCKKEGHIIKDCRLWPQNRHALVPYNAIQSNFAAASLVHSLDQQSISSSSSTLTPNPKWSNRWLFLPCLTLTYKVKRIYLLLCWLTMQCVIIWLVVLLFHMLSISILWCLLMIIVTPWQMRWKPRVVTATVATLLLLLSLLWKAAIVEVNWFCFQNPCIMVPPFLLFLPQAFWATSRILLCKKPWALVCCHHQDTTMVSFLLSFISSSPCFLYLIFLFFPSSFLFLFYCCCPPKAGAEVLFVEAWEGSWTLHHGPWFIINPSQPLKHIQPRSDGNASFAWALELAWQTL